MSLGLNLPINARPVENKTGLDFEFRISISSASAHMSNTQLS